MSSGGLLAGHTQAGPVILPSATSMDFDAFYRREYASMVALARSVCGDAAVAEDLAQEALSKAHQNWSKISCYERPGAWLRRVTINYALSRRRRVGREFTALRKKAFERHPEPIMSDPYDRVWEAVSQLPPRQRAVVALFYQEDRSTAEIAEILQCAVSTATSHLNQARTKLARELGSEITGDHKEVHDESR